MSPALSIARQRKHREQVLKELEAELESLRAQPQKSHSKRVCELRASGRYGRYVRLTRTGKPAIDQARVKQLTRLDGKFVVHSNDDTLTVRGHGARLQTYSCRRHRRSDLRARSTYNLQRWGV